MLGSIFPSLPVSEIIAWHQDALGGITIPDNVKPGAIRIAEGSRHTLMGHTVMEFLLVGIPEITSLQPGKKKGHICSGLKHGLLLF